MTPRLLRLPALTVLLCVCGLLVAEEVSHYVRSGPNSDLLPLRQGWHPGCSVRDAAGVVVECPAHGYGSMLMICNCLGCVMKEPMTGTVVTRGETASMAEANAHCR